jgi:LmbE family N-acetylglucosaminyl deacetylase
MSASRRVSALAAAIASLALPVRAQGHVPVPVAPVPQPVSPVRINGRLPAPASVMWIAAHPDDEVLVAPLLAHWCGSGRARCSLLTATRGGAGTCLLPDGCLPDLATVRSGEAGGSSQFFGADAILLSLPDGGGTAPPPWDIDAGGSREIVGTIAGFIRAEAPDLVLTFDPRHGTTCHPDHRAIAAIVLDAMKLLSAPPAVYLLETRLQVEAQPLALHFSPASPDALRFDANDLLAATGDPAWNALTSDMRLHPSQFDAAWLAAASRVPAGERAVFVAPEPAILQRTVSTCP